MSIYVCLNFQGSNYRNLFFPRYLIHLFVRRMIKRLSYERRQEFSGPFSKFKGNIKKALDVELRYDWVPDQVPCTQETLRKIKERFADEAHQLRLLKKRNIPPNEVTIELGLFFTYFSMLFSTHILHFSPFFSTFSLIFSIFS